MPRSHVLFVSLGCAFLAACADTMDPQPETFSADLRPGSEVPPVTNAPTAHGAATFTLRPGTMEYGVSVSGLSGAATGAHIHGPAAAGVNAGILVGLSPLSTATSGTLVTGSFTAPTASGVSFDSLLVLMRNGNAYINVHTSLNPGGEIRGQITRPQPPI